MAKPAKKKSPTKHSAPGRLLTGPDWAVVWRPSSKSDVALQRIPKSTQPTPPRYPRVQRVVAPLSTRVNLKKLGVTRPRKKKQKYNYSEARAQTAHDAVMATYRRKRYVKNEMEANELHMWFSGYRVPRGLTKLEVRMCLDLHRLCQNIWKQDNVNGPSPAWDPLKPMTRANFAKGLAKALACLAQAKLPEAMVDYVYSVAPRMQ